MSSRDDAPELGAFLRFMQCRDHAAVDPSSFPTPELEAAARLRFLALARAALREDVRLRRGIGIPDHLPRVLGDFELQSVIGTGGYGIVVRARQRGVERDVAVKLLRDGVLATADDFRRFQREVRVIAELRHKNIVPIHAAGNHAGIAWYAMPLLAGGSLQLQIDVARLRGAHGLPVPRAARVAGSIASALARAHLASVLHRDVSPRNVMFDERGRAYLIDFGLARSMLADGTTLTDGFAGTIEYAAPERFAGTGARDPRQDVWGVGALLYAMLSLRPPRDAGSTTAGIQDWSSREPPQVRAINREVPIPLAAIVHKALEISPANRYSTMLDLVRDLRRFRAGEPVEARIRGPIGRCARLLWRRRALVAPLLSILIAGPLGIVLTAWIQSLLDPRGTLRVVGASLAVKVETARAEDSGPPTWRSAVRADDETFELPVGRHHVRMTQPNCFPVALPAPVTIVRDRTTIARYQNPPSIVRWTRAVGPSVPHLPPVFVDLDHASGECLLVVAAKHLERLQAHSGVMWCVPMVFPFAREAWWAPIGDIARRPRALAMIDDRAGRRCVAKVLEPATERMVVETWESEGDLFDAAVIADVDRDGRDDWVAGRATDFVVLSGRDAKPVRPPIPAEPGSRLLPQRPGAAPARTLIVTGPSGRLGRLDPGAGTLDPLPTSLPAAEPRPGDDAGAAPFAVRLEASGALDRVVFVSGGAAWLVPLPVGAPTKLVERDATTATGADLVGRDGIDEVVVAHQASVTAWTADGTRRLWTNAASGTLRSHLVAGELDSSAGEDVVVGGADGRLVVLSGCDGIEQWRFDTAGAFASVPQVEDVDGDGRCEIIAVAANEQLFVLEGSRDVFRWTGQASWPIGSRPQIGRIDGRPAVVVVGTAGRGGFPFELHMPGPTIHGFGRDGSLEAWRSTARSAFLWCPDVADFDGDGTDETLAVDRAGGITAVDVDDGTSKAVPPRCSGASFGPLRPRLADLDGDGRAEILHCIRRGDRHALAAVDGVTGDSPWHPEIELPSVPRAMEVGDLGGDGSVEVVISSASGDVFVHRASDGRRIGIVATTDTCNGNCPIAVGDVDADGRPELVVAHDVNYQGFGLAGHPLVSIYDGSTLKRRWSAGSSCRVDAAPVVGDIDGDAIPDVVVALWSGRIAAFRGTDGSPLWETAVSREGIFSTPALGDLNGDGVKEVVVGTKERFVVALDGRKGTVQWRVGTSAEVWGTALLYDLDDDGRVEVLVGCDDGRLLAIEPPGAR